MTSLEYASLLQIYLTGTLLLTGDILYQGDLYESLAKFGKSLLEDSRSRKQSCNCWKDISWKGQRLEELRQTAHAKHMEAKRVK